MAIRDKDPSTKSLVVSQFTSFLDIVEDALKKQDFQFVRLDGRMAQEARARAIETFSEPSSSAPTVFLLSLTAGGVGLNLTAATRVFLLDPVSCACADLRLFVFKQVIRPFSFYFLAEVRVAGEHVYRRFSPLRITDARHISLLLIPLFLSVRLALPSQTLMKTMYSVKYQSTLPITPEFTHQSCRYKIIGFLLEPFPTHFTLILKV